MSNTVQTFNASWTHEGREVNNLAKELTDLGRNDPWSTMLAANLGKVQTWTHNLVKCVLAYDPERQDYSLILNNLVA